MLSKKNNWRSFAVALTANQRQQVYSGISCKSVPAGVEKVNIH
jgi:hypothetical protein